MPSLSRRQPSLNLRKSALSSSAASSTRSSFESNESAFDRFWTVKAAVSEDMDFPASKLSSLPSRQKKASNSLGLSIKPELHDIYQSSEEEASPNPEEVDWTSSTDEEVDNLEALETSKPEHCSHPLITLDGACDSEISSPGGFDDEVFNYHTAYAVRLPITTWHKPRLIDIPPPTLRLKRSNANNRKSAGPHSARLQHPLRKQSLTPQALADVPGLEPDTDESNKVSAPSSTYSEDFASDQPITPLTSIHPSMAPTKEASSLSGYTSLLPPLEDAPIPGTPRKSSAKPPPQPIKAVSTPIPTLRKKESSTWKSMTESITRARKATVSGIVSPDLGYYAPSIPRSKTGSDIGINKPSVSKYSTQPSQITQQFGESKRPKMKMVPRGASERQESVVLDFLLEG